MKKEINTVILIATRPDRVWKILTDYEKYPSWNPFIKSLTGKVVVGNKIKVKLEPPGSNTMTFTPKVLVNEPEKELRWLGNLLVPGLFDGEHWFELYDNNNGTTTFRQCEKFSGLLVRLFNKMLDINTTNGFKLMNQKLKELAEQA